MLPTSFSWIILGESGSIPLMLSYTACQFLLFFYFWETTIECWDIGSNPQSIIRAAGSSLVGKGPDTGATVSSVT